MKNILVPIALSAWMVFAPASAAEIDRSILPLAEPIYPAITELDARRAKAPPVFQVKAPARAPNVLIVLIDDMGFGQSSAFGGPVQMPTVDSLAREGLRYNEFHTTALCSPTRMALLTGRNAHMGNMSGISEIATGFPGNTGMRPNSVATVAEMLRLNGYATGAFGKYHEATAWEVSPSGPTDRWPTRSGFDKFYGFIGGETNQWAPSLYDGLTKVTLPHNPTYHLMTDMTDQAITWMRSEKSLTPDKPFFMYFAPGAVHAPHHVPKEWIAKYKGKFDAGWDTLREQTLARQKALGVVPAETQLAPKPAAIKDWDTLSAAEKKLFARQMEIFAAFGEYTDVEIGRLVKAIGDMGQLDNTLIFYIVGDNGASAEGGMNGVVNEMSYFNGVEETAADVLKHYDELGGPNSYGHYAAGWAVAGNTPFTWTKQVASNYGGTRNGMVVYWPARVKARGEVRSQWHHVIDIAPTILEAAGLPEPKVVNGTAQTPIQGVSMLYTLDDGNAADRHTTQYFELAGNRAVYHEGWLAGTVHKAPWERKPRATLEADTWELYDTRKDFSLRNNLATVQPEKLKQLQALFLDEAVKNKVLPIDDRTIERFNPSIAGRPDLMAGRSALTVYPGMTGMMENVFINTKNRSFSISAEVEVSKKANGTILAQGGRFGGYSLYMKEGKAMFTYNFLNMQRFTVSAKQALVPGKARIVFDFAYDGGGLGKGGLGVLSVNGKEVARGRIERTQPLIYSADEGADVGMDEGTPVSENYASPFPFTGRIAQVTVTLTESPGPAKTADATDLRKLASEKARAN